ncbi:SH3 domain-containing protein [Anaerolinea thermolimosa]|nr:SH3 domain-containing protein [Anaerolinea thermolimosa]
MQRKHWFLGLCLTLVFMGGCNLINPIRVDGQEMPRATSTEMVATPQTAPTPTPGFTSTPTLLSPDQLLWVANPVDGQVRVIDPISGATLVIIPTGMHPEQMVLGEGAAWALDREGDRVLKFSLADYTLQVVIPVPQGETNCLVAGAGFIWVGVTERPLTNILLPGEEYHETGGVVRIDPRTGQVAGYGQVGPVLDLTVARGVVWGLVKMPIETALVRIDPATLVSSPVQLAGTPDWQIEDALTASDTSLWMFSQAYGKLYRLSFEGHLYDEIRLGQHPPIGPAGMVIGDRWLWLAAPWGKVIQVDTGNDQVVAELSLDLPLSNVSWAVGAAWVTSLVGGKVFRIDPMAQTASLEVAIGPTVRPTPMVTATPILRAHRPCPDAPYSRLEVGDQVRTLEEPALPQRLRKEAGKDAERVGWIQPGEVARVLEGPVCADGWVWWKVETLTGGYTGWAAEGDGTEYWLIPWK